MNKPYRILIADDNRDMVFLLKKGVGEGDYLFIEASDGEEALRKVKEEKPDLILLDLKMPRKSGFEVIREVREMYEFRDIPIIVLTVVDNPTEKITALEMGASDFLVKPPSSAELKARVNTQLQLHRISSIFKRYSEHLETMVSRKTRELKDFATKLEEMVEDKVGVIRRQNEELMVSMRSAQRIQRSIIPADFPKVQGLGFRAVYKARDAVGGDIYNVFRIDENNVGIFVGDVSGHGIPSAMITIFMKQEVLYHSKRVHPEGGYTVVSPADLLRLVNRSFVQNNIGEGTYFVTAVYCVYSLKTRQLKLAIAGHHALPILKRADGALEVIRIEGFPIGWFEEIDGYTEKVFTLEKGDSVLFYSDGLLELCMEDEEGAPRGGLGAPNSGSDSSSGTSSDVIQRISEIFVREDIEREVERLVEERSRMNGKLKDDLTVLLMKVS